MVNKQVTTSTQDHLELFESLCDDFSWRQASTYQRWLSSARLFLVSARTVERMGSIFLSGTREGGK